MSTAKNVVLAAPTLSLWSSLHDPGAFQRYVLARLFTEQHHRAFTVRRSHPPSKPAGLEGPEHAHLPFDHSHGPDDSYQAFVSRSQHRAREPLEIDHHNFASRLRDR